MLRIKYKYELCNQRTKNYFISYSSETNNSVRQRPIVLDDQSTLLRSCVKTHWQIFVFVSLIDRKQEFPFSLFFVIYCNTKTKIIKSKIVSFVYCNKHYQIINIFSQSLYSMRFFVIFFIFIRLCSVC